MPTETQEVLIEKVRAKYGDAAADGIQYGIYLKTDIVVMLHGPIKHEWPDPPSKRMMMEDGTKWDWMYEDHYWEKSQD